MPLEAGLGRLKIAARAGVSFAVSDGKGRQVYSGSETPKHPLELPTGLYAVEWLSGGESSETIVRVAADAPPVLAAYDPHSYTAAALAPAASEVPRIVSELSGHRQRETSIAIVVTGKDAGASRRALDEVRLSDPRERERASDEAHHPPLLLASGEAARCFPVSAGRYILSYRAVTGETLQQALPALPGRQTVVFLEAAEGELLVAAGEGFVRQKAEGIDPASMAIISVRGDEANARIRERLRLAGILLRNLATGTSSLDPEFVRVLRQRRTDPLLRLAAALVIIAQIEAGKSLGAFDDPPADPAGAVGWRARWLATAASWLSRTNFHQLPTDVTAGWWQLLALGHGRAPRKLPASISLPPMFACSWRWAARRSAAYPNAVRRSAALRAAARSGSASDPWLCWKAASAKAMPAVLKPGPAASIDALIEQVGSKTRQLTQSKDVRAGTQAQVFARLDPDAAILALQAQSFALVAAADPALGSPSSLLASLLSLPIGTLRRRLILADEQLNAVLGDRNRSTGSQATQGAAAMDRPAPGLLLPIPFPDDPQKGRFGGSATAGGYAARAQFASTRSSDWTRIELAVEGPARDGDPVEFHLHDSFHPQVETKRFAKGRAKLAVTAWGGFTLGVWLPAAGVELELDLAAVPGAPPPIRLR